MPEYSHVLIPDRVDYAPTPNHVAEFLTALEQLGAAPLDSKLKVCKLSGKSRSVVNPFTGQTDTYPIRSSKTIESTAAVSAAIKDLDDYNIVMLGKGPPEVPPLEFDFDGPYDFLVYCCLRTDTVSTSDYHDEIPLKLKTKPAYFGEPCDNKHRTGIYHHPNTLEVMEVPNAGCARFWIEFEFGKLLFPEITDNLELLPRSIVETAQKCFDVSFVQGCHWCA